LSKLTNDSRNSIGAFDEDGATKSNRSSITIKGVQTNGTNGLVGNSNGGSGGALGDFDFDKALVKFANEREFFLDDLSFAAGAPPTRPPPLVAPRQQTVKISDGSNAPTPNSKRNQLKSVGGSIRRRISFRDMNSMKRQPTITQAKRTCKLNFSSDCMVDTALCRTRNAWQNKLYNPIVYMLTFSFTSICTHVQAIE
jgi:hypothetical protein